MDANYKGELYPKNLKDIHNDFAKAIKVIENHFKSDPIKLSEIAKRNNKSEIVIEKEMLIEKFRLENYVKPTKKYGHDLKGLYVFAQIAKSGKPEIKYVGISRCLFKRIKDHGFGKTKYMATLVNLMAKHRYIEKHGSNEGYKLKDHLKKTQAEVKNWYVALYPIDCNFELHMIEPHLSYHWKSYWNTFETH